MKSKNRQLLEIDKEFILWLFSGRCGRCGKPGMQKWNIHEIIPISHGRKALVIENRIPLCQTSQQGFRREGCHEWAHNIGTSKSIPILQKLRLLAVQRKFGIDGENQAQNKQKQEGESEL